MTLCVLSAAEFSAIEIAGVTYTTTTTYWNSMTNRNEVIETDKKLKSLYITSTIVYPAV